VWCRGRPLRGVLFWRWDLQVYAGMAPADYGVQVGDTTFDLIRDNAAKVKALAAQQPPNASCKVGCWVPEVHSGTFSTVNRCALPPPLFHPSGVQSITRRAWVMLRGNCVELALLCGLPGSTDVG